jgi:hypothetical protein
LPELIPFRWPAGWRDAAKIDLVSGTPYNCALGDNIPADVAGALRERGIKVASLKNAPATVLHDARWPQVQTGAKGEIDTGPTGNPWIDANGFAIQAMRAIAPETPVWLAEDPAAGKAVRVDDYRLAVADAAAYGGWWAPPLDCPAWRDVAATQKFFQALGEWREFRPIARLAVVSDFSGARRDFALEILNLLTRLSVPFAAAPKSRRFDAKRFAMTIDLDQRDSNEDPWTVANEIAGKLGRRNDLVRLWNGASLIPYYASSPKGGADLLQLINYSARRPDQPITAGVMATYRAARIYTLERPEGAPIELHRARSGVEIYVPPFAVYAGIELTR